MSYTMGGRVSDTGMVCGGMIDLCYLHLDSDNLEFFKQLEKVLVERGDGALEIDLAPFATARPADAPAHGAESAATIVGAPALSVVDVEPGVAAGVTDADGAPVYLEPLCPEGLTYIFGSGHVGRALAPVLAGAGFAVVSCDNRAEMLSEELLPGVLDRRLVDYGDLSATCETVRTTSSSRPLRAMVATLLWCPRPLPPIPPTWDVWAARKRPPLSMAS